MKVILRKKLYPVAQLIYVGAGMVTSQFRARPDFILIGASRSGTTSLFRALSLHPGIRRPPVNKGVRYFDLNYERSWAWYRAHFPLESSAVARRFGASAAPKVTFEASGYYMFHPFAIERLAKKLPDVKLVAMLRDPVERAYSGWKHERSRGYETEDFESALALEDDRLAGEIGRMRRDPTYISYCHHHLAHRARGEYAQQLARVFDVFPRDQVHVMISEEFFHNPVEEFGRLTSFLELDPWRPAQFFHQNAEPGDGMSQATRDMLREHYQPGVQELERILGRDINWPQAAPRRNGLAESNESASHMLAGIDRIRNHDRISNLD